MTRYVSGVTTVTVPETFIPLIRTALVTELPMTPPLKADTPNDPKEMALRTIHA